MQVLQARGEKYILLEFDEAMVENAIRSAGYSVNITEEPRALIVDVLAEDRQAPLLLFDAADENNAGWFSRCQFYVDGGSGAVLQTPLAIANIRDMQGKVLPNALRIHILKELPVRYRLPGRQPITEQVVCGLLHNLLLALTKIGVGICGGRSIVALTGRHEDTLTY
jgi:hypothetical protein